MNGIDCRGGTEEEDRAALARFFEWLWPDPAAAPTDARLTDTGLHAQTGHEREHTMNTANTVKRTTLGLLGLAALAALSPGGVRAQAPATGTLTVIVSGVHDRKGWLRVHLYARPDGFPADPSKALAAQDFPLSSLAPQAALDPLTVTFKNLPPGGYALCSIHDYKGDNHLSTNFLGIPTEDYAISNNPHPNFRSPHFSEARFPLGAGEAKTVTLRLHH